MTFTIQNIISSVALHLQSLFSYPVYDSPTIDTAFPCFFVFLMNPVVTDEIIPYGKRDIPLDVVFVQQRNVPNANQQIHAIAETLDEAMDMLPYTDGTNTVPLHTYERSWSIEDQELHYQFTLRQRVTILQPGVKMNTMEEANVEVNEA